MRAVRLSQYNSFCSVVHFRDRFDVDDDVYRQTAINFKLECVLLYLSQLSEERKELGDHTYMTSARASNLCTPSFSLSAKSNFACKFEALILC